MGLSVASGTNPSTSAARYDSRILIVGSAISHYRIDIARQVAEGLQAAHDTNVVIAPSSRPTF